MEIHDIEKLTEKKIREDIKYFDEYTYDSDYENFGIRDAFAFPIKIKKTFKQMFGYEIILLKGGGYKITR